MCIPGVEVEPNTRAKVICADDNPLVTDALRIQIDRAPDLQWMGCAAGAEELIEAVSRGECPDLVLLDVDMPGKDPLEAIGELTRLCRGARVLMYSGMVEREIIDRSIDAGAWGYVVKSDGEDALLEAMRSVLAGEVALSPEAQAAYRS